MSYRGPWGKDNNSLQHVGEDLKLQTLQQLFDSALLCFTLDYVFGVDLERLRSAFQ